MYTIGEFAAFGRASARMLRHYDALGLLTPAHVDPHSGYRYYSDPQLLTLLRIVELRRLGCSLDDVAEVIGADDEQGALRGVLLRRHAELTSRLAEERGQLEEIEALLRRTEGEPMSTPSITYQRIEPVTVYASSGIAPGMGPENVSPVIRSLLPSLEAALIAAGVDYQEPGIFWYEPVDGTDELRVHVSWVAEGEPRAGDGYEVVELPRVERAAVLSYRGDMPGIGAAWESLTRAALDAGEQLRGPTREVYLETEPRPQSEWLTELVLPVAPRDGRR